MSESLRRITKVLPIFTKIIFSDIFIYAIHYIWTNSVDLMNGNYGIKLFMDDGEFEIRKLVVIPSEKWYVWTSLWYGLDSP